jgi:hypothetical protein
LAAARSAAPEPIAPAQPAQAAGPSTQALSAARPPSSCAPAATEWLRVKWFALGALATALGVWVGARL